MESDVLLELLQQLSEATSYSGDNVPAGTTPGSELEQQATTELAHTVVGPTPAELESINELIRFDHVYYKPEPTVKNIQPKEVVAVGTTAGKVESTKMYKTILPAGEPIHITQPVAVQVQPPTPADDDDVIIIDSGAELSDSSSTSDMSVDDVVEGLNTLEDLESFLQQDQVSTTTDLFAERKPLSSNDTFVSKDTNVHSAKKTEKVTSSPIHSMPMDVTDFSFSMSPEHLFGLDTDFISSSNSLRSPSSSYYSDASSPRSDGLSGALDDDVWEESFTELFPSLA